jgi:hypothetical protein
VILVAYVIMSSLPSFFPFSPSLHFERGAAAPSSTLTPFQPLRSPFPLAGLRPRHLRALAPAFWALPDGAGFTFSLSSQRCYRYVHPPPFAPRHLAATR